MAHDRLTGLESIKEPVKEEFEALGRHLKSFLSTDIPIIDSVFEHLVEGGGKRFRPLLILLVASCSGKSNTRDIFRLAVAVEFLHTATLLHDDVVDQSDLRRGNRVAYRIWGAEPSVLSGDFLFSRAFNLLVEIGHIGVLEAISGATTEMARGEVLQLLRSYSTATTREEYLEVIRGKTASIITASCKAAAYLAGFDDASVGCLKDYGHSLGMSFQIVDDVLDYTSEKGVLGKTIGKDFLEGKVTLPLILLMEELDTGDRQNVSEIFLKDSPEHGDFETVRDLMEKHGALTKAMEIAAQYRDKALESLAGVETGRCRSSLESLAAYVLERCS
jgi:octaprenyl-diphosphate synthase